MRVRRPDPGFKKSATSHAAPGLRRRKPRYLAASAPPEPMARNDPTADHFARLVRCAQECPPELPLARIEPL